MADVIVFESEASKVEPPIIQIDLEVNIRPQLELIGIDEVERGVCQDTYTNRAILRRAKLQWDPVYSTNGVPTGLIQARSEEMEMARRVLSLAEKRPVMLDPTSLNSDYLTGYALLGADAADLIVPPWVLNSTRAYIKEQENGPTRANSKRGPLSQPHRCNAVKEDRVRCMLWSSGRLNDDGFCRVHLRSISRKPGEDIERARAKLTQSAPYAVDVLEELMESASSEPVRLKSATEILDRAGVRGGIEFDGNLNVSSDRNPAEVVRERLGRLAQGAIDRAAVLATDNDIIDAEVVEEAPVQLEIPNDN